MTGPTSRSLDSGNKIWGRRRNSGARSNPTGTGRTCCVPWIPGSFYLARIAGAYAGGMILDTGFFEQGFVWLIWVEERFRRRGVATTLIRHAEEACGTDKLFTSTNESNKPAQRLFETLGFERTGKVENLDEGDPEIFYFKQLK